jgi:TolA-binding protein
MRVRETSENLGASAEQLVKLACDELGEMPARSRAEGYLELARRDSRRTRRKRVAFGFAAALTLIALALTGHRWLVSRPGGPLSYAVEGGRIDPSGAVEANGPADATVRFSDGTEIAFPRGARGRIRSVSEHGARILVSGKVAVNVVPWRGSHWLFDAGPFLITVTGTTFTAEWQEADGRLDIALKTGSIAVSGPLSDEAIALRAGQRLTLSSRDKEVLIRELDAPPSRRAETLMQDAGTADGSPPSSLGTSRSERAAPDTSSPATTDADTPRSPVSNWTSALAAGNFAVILRQAEERGLDKVIAEVSSDELAALSDAARYSRRDDVARRALAAQRRRFPRSARANDAAFLLGRLEEAAQRPELALDWYDRCLEESPHGTYVSEALGRKMTVIQRLHGDARARPIAEEYVRRFGSGTYAAAARALIRAP